MDNLDALNADELWERWSRYQHATRKECEALVGDRRPGYTRIVKSTLACYCSNKATAMRCRLNGDIRAALMYEGIADRVYDELPADLRW